VSSESETCSRPNGSRGRPSAPKENTPHRLGVGISLGIEPLFQMPRNVFRHLEHGNLLLASKNSFEGIAGIDQRLFSLRPEVCSS
jgi:hypothetical protein